VIYTPVGGALAVDAAALPKPIRLVDPRTGAVAEELAELACPTGTDWLIVCGPGWQDA
jgi:heptaprenylglyceryl phosphate synthase